MCFEENSLGLVFLLDTNLTILKAQYSEQLSYPRREKKSAYHTLRFCHVIRASNYSVARPKRVGLNLNEVIHSQSNPAPGPTLMKGIADSSSSFSSYTIHVIYDHTKSLQEIIINRYRWIWTKIKSRLPSSDGSEASIRLPLIPHQIAHTSLFFTVYS